MAALSRGFKPSGPNLPYPCLMLVTDRHLAGGEDRLCDVIGQTLDGGVNVVQLREKDMLPLNLYTLALRVLRLTDGRCPLLINGNEKLARDLGAGVHLPEGAEPPEAPWEGLIWGRSVHTDKGAIRALGDAPRYMIAGPIYETASHPGAVPAGLEFIRTIVEYSQVPVIGIGGITPANARAVIQAGASGIAVISAILAAPSPAAAARDLREVVEASYHPLTSNIQPLTSKPQPLSQ